MVSGNVGDIFIVIERKGKMGKPTMSILREENGVYYQADTIIYFDNAPEIGSRTADDFKSNTRLVSKVLTHQNRRVFSCR